MATTTFRDDYLGREITAPTSNALDHLGRPTTSTVDYMGRSLRRTVRAMAAVWTLGQEIQYADGSEYTVTTAGTSHATVAPASPAVGATVTDGTAVLTRSR